MKAYRKKWIGIVMAMVFCFSPVSAFAAEGSVHISSGLELDAEETECTFEDNRLVYGEAVPGTEITFTVSKMNRFGGMAEVYTEDVLVGSMGLFSVTLPLEKGNNYISMTAEGKTQEVVIKRVSQNVKTQLQRLIALPGLSVILK